MPIRVAIFQNTQIVGIQRDFSRLTVDIFGGKAAVLSEQGLHEPIENPMDSFSMVYDDIEEVYRDQRILTEWMDNNNPVKVEIFSPKKVVFSSDNHAMTVEFEEKVQKPI